MPLHYMLEIDAGELVSINAYQTPRAKLIFTVQAGVSGVVDKYIVVKITNAQQRAVREM